MLLSNSGRLVDKSTVTRPGLPLRLVQPGSRTQPCFGAALAAFTAIAVASAPGQLAAQTDDAAGARPNILVVVSDDIGWGQPGFNGGTEVGTPSLDRIAYEGVKLTQFYVAPGCSPTRYSLMSGRYHWKTGNKDELPTGNTTIGMLLDERTIAEALRDTGYSTWMVGKWHLGQWYQAHLPLQRGFDHHYGLYSGTFGYYSHSRAGILDLHRNGRPVVEEGYSTFLIAEEAIQLIERHDGRNPFFLYLAFNAAHLPAAGVPDEYAERYAHLQSSLRRSQRGQLKAMDDALGWVIDALDRKGVLDDTLVVYFNDNGGTGRAGGNGPYRGVKGDYLEGGIRVPAAMRWPGHIPAASQTDALLHVVDVFPTLAGVAGASTKGGLPLDGIDAWQAIAAGSPSPRHEVVHSLKVIRSGDWKLISEDGKAYGGQGRSVQQLYNIGTDPYEETNLASSEEAKVAELRERLDYHRQFARDSATATRIRGSPAVYGEAENAAYAAEVRTALSQRDAGNPGPVLLRLEVSGTTAKLVFNETLDSRSVPPASAFRAVVLPGYRAVDVTEVGVYGSDVLLALSQALGIGETLGLTYEVPDAGAVRDADSLAADGVTWVAAESGGAFGQSPLTATVEAAPLSHDGLSPFTLRLRFSEAVSTSDITLRDLAVGVTGGRVSEAQRVAGQSWLWDLALLPSGPAEITVTLPATESCSDTGAVCTTAGKALSNSPQLAIPFVRPVVSIAAPSTTVTEGEAAEFQVTLSEAAPESLTVAVGVAETGSKLVAPLPASVTVPPGATSATLSVATAGYWLVEADSTVTASLVAGAGYALGSATSASITVEDVSVGGGTFPRPNILVFLSDDMGWGQPGFNGGTEVATPSMDRIANEGVKLTQFYVQPRCAPTRASLVTGRYAWKTGMAANPDGRKDDGLLLDERTIAEALLDSGYATWLVGKWHLGHWGSDRLPLQRGFEHHYGFYNGFIDYFRHFRPWRHWHKIFDWHRNGRPLVESGYSTLLLADEASQLIERHDGSRPFFLYVAFNAPHDPYQAPLRYTRQYDHLPYAKPDRNQRAMVKAMDDAIGQVVDALERRGVLDETLVMFLNDNGGEREAGGNSPYRGLKSSYHEGGIRVPAVMRWPDQISAGSESDALLHVVDLFPTLAGLAGADTGGGLPLDGLDAWDAIANGAESPREEVVHSLGVIRMGDWKLLERDEAFAFGDRSTPQQLYNIAEDPYETTNLAPGNAAKIAELQERLAYHQPFARDPQPGEEIPGLNSPTSPLADDRPVVFGKAENTAFGAEVKRALTQRNADNLGPGLLRIEAFGNQVKVVYNEPLDSESVPPASAFKVVMLPGYRAIEATEVAVTGAEVLLRLAQPMAAGETAGLTYDVPDGGAIRDVDRLDAGGITWVTAPVSAALLGQDATLSALSLSGIDIGTFAAATTSYTASVPHATVNTTVTATANHSAATVSVSPGATVSLAEGANEITVTVTAADGTTVQTYRVTVTRTLLPMVSIAAVSSPVAEGEAAEFEVTLSEAAPESLTVAVGVTETGSMLTAPLPASVTVPPGATSATLRVVTEGDSVVEADSTVTASLVAGAGYVLGAATSASLVVGDVPARAGTSPRPNIVVFLADDMGWGQPGFNGGTEVATPHMDRIADEGVKLAQFYAQPVGAASRGSLFTGRHAWKTGLSRNPDPGRDGGLPLDERTMAEALRDAGYATWLVGKWQLGHWGSDRLPLQRGFEHHYGFYNEFIDSYGHFRRGQGSDTILDWHRNGRPAVESGYATELLAEEASQLIARHDGSHPFFLLVAFNAPHDPYQAPETYTQQFGHLQLSEEQRKQRAMVKALDDAIGKVVGALDTRDVLDETLVMFLNDNGGPSQAGGNGPYRGQKGYYLEGGIRVPAALRWPGRITAGSVSDALLHVVDLFPTFAGLAGADAGAGLALDGIDAWEAIAEGAASPRDEIAFSPKVIRAGDWKLIEKDGISVLKGVKSSVQLYNLAEDPYETTNLASSETERAAELWERLVVQHPSLRIARAGEAIPGLGSQGSPPVVFGAAENAAYGAEAARALAELDAGNPGPTLVRLEAAGDRVKLVYDEPLDTGSVPAADAFTVVVKPGYRGVGVTDVAVSGTDVLLTLAESPALAETVGLTYEVPDSGAIRDVDRLDAVGVTWVTALVSVAFSGQDATLSALSLSGIDIGTFSAVTTEYAVVVPNATSSTTVTAAASAAGASVSVSPGATVSLAEGANEITVTVTGADGTTVRTYRVTVTRAVLPVVSIAAVSSPVKEGEAAGFEVTLSEATAQALEVAVNVTESGAMLAGAPPGSVTVPPGTTSVALSVATAGDLVVEADSTVTASVAAGTGYTVGTAASASVAVEDDDLAAFTVTATPTTVKEGETATLTVAVSNGVTFAEDQSVDLAVSGTASPSDHEEVPAALTLVAGASSATAKLIAKHDREEEPDETLTVTASLGGDPIGSATVTIESVSHDATLSGLSLSGIDIGTFASGTTAYTASVPNATTSTTVTAAANHPEADVSISPGGEVSLAEGANEIAVTVTAEDGTTTKTYTVTVTRAALPKVTIAAGASPLTEGSAASFTVTLDQPATEALSVAVEVIESGSALSGTPPASVAFGVGDSSAPLSVPTAADSVVEPASTVTATLTAGTGYTIGEASAASVTVEDDDAATFTVVAEPGAIDEGDTSTLTVAISNGVTFAGAQTISLATSGTASASDYTGVPPTLTLPAAVSAVTATLSAEADQEEEQAETVTVTASHGDSAIGSATVTINSISHEATLAALNLSGIDIGTFASGTTAYTASVPNATTSTTVTAAASHAEATLSISPGAEVSLAEGANEIRVTVTAEDGTAKKTYTVTVTRMGLPVVSIAAVQERVSEAELAHFTVSRTGPTTEPLDVRVLSASTTSEEVQTLTVRIGSGERSVTRRIQVGDNRISEDDVTLTWTLAEGEDYTVSADHASASVVLEENDIPEFAVSVEPAEITEGESATVTVAITNGVTFRQPQTIALSVSGTASASDHAGLPATLTLDAFGSSPKFSATATLTAAVDQEEEEAETVTVTASHSGSAIGSAAVTINSVSQDAALSSLSLSGVDIGTFSAETTAYAASVANSVETTTVMATASHSEASVEIAPGSEVRLAEGENTVTVTVTAGDGKTTRTYSVTVTRASPPVVSVAAVASRVSEGEPAEFLISLTEPAAESLRVGIRWDRSDQSQFVTQNTVFPAGTSSKTPSFSKSDDNVVREDLTVTITLEDGEGYRVSEDGRSAQVVLEENDAAEFGVSVDPASVAEGETAKVQVRTTNGVTFAADQTITLSFAGSTATKGKDYSVSTESLTLRAGRRRVTASLTAITDSEQEEDETVRFEAAHGGEVIGTATLTITGGEPAPEAAGAGFSLAPENASPSGIWSDGETAWVADLADARLYAYRREDGERRVEKDISTQASPMGLWSDGETLWVAHLGGGLRAHRLSDGARLPDRDLALEGNTAPGGVWSDGETVWVSEWLGDIVHAYRVSSGRREAARDIRLAGGNLMPAGLWSDGRTLWVADWRERVYAYRLSNGGREPGRDVITGLGDTDPTGLWSADGTLLSTGWEGGEVRAYRLAEAAADTSGKKPGSGPTARAVSLPAIADPALRAVIGAALNKSPRETVSPQDLAGLEELTARNAGIRDLSGLERAVRLKALDLGFNPLADLRPLAALPALESLNLDGATTDLQSLASLPRLQRLSLRSNGIEDLWPLAGLTSLTELSLGGNRIADLRPLAGLGSLAVLRLDRNRIADVWPLASLAGLEALELEANRVQDLRPLAGLGRLRALELGGNGLSELHALSGLKGLRDLGLAGNAVENLGALSNLTALRRLDLRGNAVADLRPLRGLPSLVWVHVGGSGIVELTPLDGLDGLTVAGRDDLGAPSHVERRVQRPRGLEFDPGDH